MRIASALASNQRDGKQGRTLQLFSIFAPAVAAAQTDARSLLAWEPLARTGRQLFPEEFAALDAAAAASFPFGADRVQAAHAQWTADWLAWEHAHDAEYKARAAAVEEELAQAHGSPAVRARLDVVEREKLELYQRRYQEYVQVGKALQALLK